ncbi:hypothetical protein TcasGA2_TC034806 [Tribolium castaneum]|uniref:Uncharacterized protein n=1 Tax=Tribolium castaneum TaxID=7070 RepID=A0A139WEQ6_TRICA|nr:hypothetical protein TcasGA2_TC034806 [Tribolium castaneum]
MNELRRLVPYDAFAMYRFQLKIQEKVIHFMGQFEAASVINARCGI